MNCAKWIGEGPHLHLLEILLDLGLDPTLIDSPHKKDWPEPSSPDWFAEDIAPDPFFIEYQTMLLKDNQGFANNSPLYEAILLGSLESVNKRILRSDKDETNFLGQRPLHLAISNVTHLTALIDAGHDVDATDSYGITPLMYAAAVNQEECLIALLDAGADPQIQDTRYKRTFIKYAAIRGHWNLIFKALRWIETVAGKEIAESWTQYATIMYHVVDPDYLEQREVKFRQLLAMCGSVDFTFNDPDKELEDNTLLHFARSVEDVDALFEHEFTKINHANSSGQHALMKIMSKQCRPDVIRRLLDAGADIDLKDNFHHTTIYYVLDKLQNSDANTRVELIFIAETDVCVLAHLTDALPPQYFNIMFVRAATLQEPLFGHLSGSVSS
ncbi:putative ankyrin repeat protein [Lachnellula suecica]|uniref:Putative ankyrin repeat protein n=1 Tax=Lachnellula suecica TaxID=602035 RepID=A0A8T9CA44_9HELO|nr:putative ankyrin repeat protein [Lachnellula suecica]